jgi:hypothetical protein
MNVHYLRSKLKAYRQARSDEERSQNLYFLAVHLNLIRPGERVRAEHRALVFGELRQMGIGNR